MLFGKLSLGLIGAYALLASGAVVEIYKDENCQQYISTKNLEYNGGCVHTDGFLSFKIKKDGNNAENQWVVAHQGHHCEGPVTAVSRATDLNECVRARNPNKPLNYGSNSIRSKAMN